MAPRPFVLVSRFAAITVTLLAVGYGLPAIAQSSHSLSVPSKKFALVVGVSRYASPEFPELHYASTDATAVAAALKVHGFTVETLTGETATRANVLRSLKNLRRRTGKGDVGLFYFSGHGLLRGNESYINPYDSTPDESLLSLEELQNLLGSAAGTSLIVLDSCESGVHGNGGAPWSDMPVRTLFSTQPGDASYESERLQHGVFTYYLLQGLRGDAADDRALITWRSLTDFIERKMSTVTKSRGMLQVPLALGPASGDVILSDRNRAPLVSVAFDAPPNAQGWNNSDVTVSFAAPSTLTVYASDNAGNVETTSVMRIDSAAPGIVAISPASWLGNHAFVVMGSEFDNLDKTWLLVTPANDIWKAYDANGPSLGVDSNEGSRATRDDYFDEESAFFTWANTVAEEELWGGTISGDFFDSEWNSLPLGANIYYLSQFPGNHFDAVTSCKPSVRRHRAIRCCRRRCENVRSPSSYSDLERQEMMRIWDNAIRTGDPAAYELVCSSYPESIYCAMARQELDASPDVFRAKGIKEPTSPTARAKQDDENVVRIKISSLIAAFISVIALLVTVALWVLKFLADNREKPKPLIALK